VETCFVAVSQAIRLLMSLVLPAAASRRRWLQAQKQSIFFFI
jgi:hypothetical protein